MLLYIYFTVDICLIVNNASLAKRFSSTCANYVRSLALNELYVLGAVPLRCKRLYQSKAWSRSKAQANAQAYFSSDPS